MNPQKKKTSRRRNKLYLMIQEKKFCALSIFRQFFRCSQGSFNSIRVICFKILHSFSPELTFYYFFSEGFIERTKLVKCKYDRQQNRSRQVELNQVLNASFSLFLSFSLSLVVPFNTFSYRHQAGNYFHSKFFIIISRYVSLKQSSAVDFLS